MTETTATAGRFVVGPWSAKRCGGLPQSPAPISWDGLSGVGAGNITDTSRSGVLGDK